MLQIFTCIGVLWVTFYAYRISMVVYRRVFRKGYDLKSIYCPKGDGSIIITGATDGIGLEYTYQFISRGFGVVMIARNEKKLKHRIKEIKEKHPQANVDYIQFDFDTYNYPDENGQTQYSKLFQKIDCLEAEIVGIVNNVGILTIQPYEFMPHEVIDRMIKVNCLPAAHLTRHIIPKLLKRKSKSLILNIGAGFGEHGFPGVAVYGGTKAFIHNLTESLSSQYGGEIDVICSIPSPVESNMNPPEMKIPFSITARQHVEGTLKEIGYVDQTYAHLKHDIISLIAKTPLFI